MDIPALSMAMAQYNINSQVGVAMLDKSLDMSAAMGDALTSMIDRSAIITDFSQMRYLYCICFLFRIFLSFLGNEGYYA